MIPMIYPLTVGAILFALGLFCLAAHRSAVRILLGIELMLNASILNFVAFGAQYNDVGGAVFSIAIMAGAASEAAVGLALVFALFAIKRRSDVELSDELAR
mgnify:CR=1 FL=1